MVQIQKSPSGTPLIKKRGEGREEGVITEEVKVVLDKGVVLLLPPDGLMLI